MVDGCRDGSLELLETMAESDPRLKPLLVDHGGETLTRQRGAETASGDVLLFLDDDVIAGPNLARNHASHHVNQQGLVVLGYMPVNTQEGGPPTELTGIVYGTDYELECRSYERDAAPSPPELLGWQLLDAAGGRWQSDCRHRRFPTGDMVTGTSASAALERA